ncbi:MAG: Dabb family protein [Salinibacterium sp.]|nr:Dabb family protein [Salinibacterium sp.]
MIRHVVSWRLRPESIEDKAEATSAIAAALEPLVGVIPGLHSLTVRPNLAYHDKNWDAVLVADFDSVASLIGYQEHPAHQAAGAVPRSLLTEQATVDYEV